MAQSVTNFGPIRVQSLASREPLTLKAENAFDELRVAEYSPLIELDSSNGLSTLRDKQTTANGGTITATGGEIRLRTGTTANGSAKLETAERGRYQPGIVGLAGIGVRRPTAPSGSQYWQAGYYDDNNGFFFGEDATGFYVQLRVGGTDKSKVRQSSWNVDTVDGTGDSGLTLDLSKPTVLRFPFVWYFGGPIEVQALLIDEDDGNKDKLVTLHRFGATAGEPIIEQPKQPVTAYVDNGGDTNSLDLHVGGRQFAVLGRYNPNRRITSETVFDVTSIGTTLVPLLTMRKKTAQESKSVKVEGFDVISADDMQIALILGGGLTGESFGSFTNISDSETALEVDTSATAISGGESLFETILTGGQGNQTNVAGVGTLGLDIPNGTNVTLAVRKRTGTGGTASGVLRLEEEW